MIEHQSQDRRARWRGWLLIGPISLALTVSGCWFKREGALYPSSGNSVISVTLQALPDGGLIKGSDQASGEWFDGKFYNLKTPPPAIFRGDLDTGVSEATFAYGSLQGDQGTLIDCRILFGEGLPPPDVTSTESGPHGLGLCLDAVGNTYVLKF